MESLYCLKKKFTSSLLLLLRWSVDCDDDGSSSSSALVCSHVAFKSDAGQANPATGRAGKCLPFWCHVLALALMASQSALEHTFVALLLALLRSIAIFCAPATSVSCMRLKQVGRYFEFFQDRFQIIFMAFLLATYFPFSTGKFAVKNLLWQPGVFHPNYVAKPPKLPYSKKTF